MAQDTDKGSGGWTIPKGPKATLDVDSKEALENFMAAAARISGPSTKAIAPGYKKAELPATPASRTEAKTETKDSTKQSPKPQSTDYRGRNKMSDFNGGVYDLSPKARAPWAQKPGVHDAEHFSGARTPWAQNRGVHNPELSAKARAPWAANRGVHTAERNHNSKRQKQPPLWQSFVRSQSPERRSPAEPRPNSLAESRLAAEPNATNQEEIVFSQHLYTLQRVRRDDVEDNSTDRGLSDTSSIRSNGDTPWNIDVSRARPRSDIRSTIAPKHHLQDYGDRWVKVNWNAAAREKTDDDTIFANPSFLSKFVSDWMKDAAHNIRVNLDIPNHWVSDIETETGRFLMPIEVPDTIVDPRPITDDPGWNFRRQEMSSDIMLKKHMADLERRAKDSKNKVRGTNGDWRAFIRVGRKPAAHAAYNPKISPAFPVRNPSSGPESAVESTEGVDSSATSHVMDGRGRYALGPQSKFAPSVPCYLRPALKTDMGAVAQIYNWEVTEGMQALDSSPVTVDNFKTILDTTEKLGMPFIVAVRGSARDIRATKGNFEFSPYMQLSPYLADPEDVKQNGAILGFAYLSVWEPGLAGDGKGSSRASARINLFVDSKYRRKKIGFSLLDKLLSTVSRRFTSEQAYDFVDISNSLVYKHPLGHDRQYFRLYLTYFVKHAHVLFNSCPEAEKEQESYRTDLVWVKKLLEKNFGFVEKVCFETSHRSSNYAHDRPIYWLDSVVFEHTCHLDARFTSDY